MTAVRGLLVTLSGALLMAGCAPSSYSDEGIDDDLRQPVEQPAAPTVEPEPVLVESESDPDLDEPEAPVVARWTCYYEPTFNYDWHDDALCTNGIKQRRPYLREWDDYITEYELMESAREYEQYLNAE